MKIERHDLARTTLEDFARKHRLVMEVHERSATDGPGRFYAHFKCADTKDGPFLVGEYGDGRTPEAAVEAYGRKITGKVLVIDSWTPKRREIVVPVIVDAARADRKEPQT